MSDFGTYYVSVMNGIKNVISGIAFDEIVIGYRKEIENYPTAWISESMVDLNPATFNTSENWMEFNVVVVEQQPTLISGLTSALNLAGQIKDAIEAERSLGGTVLNTEVIRFDPGFERRGAFYRYYCGVILRAQILR